MSHPIRNAVDRADWWRGHLKNRCRPMTVPINSSRPLVAEIQATVAGFYGISVDEMLTRTREHSVVRPRQIAMYLARRFAKRSFPWIGSRFGGMNHTTVVHACSAIERLIAVDVELRDDVEELARRIACA